MLLSFWTSQVQLLVDRLLVEIFFYMEMIKRGAE